jgi:hypothetical protein
MKRKSKSDKAPAQQVAKCVGRADLPVIGGVAGVDGSARGTHRRAELVGDRFGQPMLALRQPAPSDTAGT